MRMKRQIAGVEMIGFLRRGGICSCGEGKGGSWRGWVMSYFFVENSNSNLPHALLLGRMKGKGFGAGSWSWGVGIRGVGKDMMAWKMLVFRGSFVGCLQ